MSINITVPILSATNFNSWKFLITAITVEKEPLSSVVTDNPPRGKKKYFISKNAKARALIIQGVSDKHLDLIKYSKTAKALLCKMSL